jgi:hypothetical protein
MMNINITYELIFEIKYSLLFIVFIINDNINHFHVWNVSTFYYLYTCIIYFDVMAIYTYIITHFKHSI